MGVFSASDYKNAESLGIKSTSLDRQWELLNKGFPSIVLARPAIIDDGIHRYSEKEERHFKMIFENEKENYSILKFVPASGAASRMFLPFREMLENPENEQSAALLSKLSDFPFYQDICNKASELGVNLESLLSDPFKAAEFILNKEGLNYNEYPKGLITFYSDDKQSSNAFEQQVDEAEQISEGNIHFTVAEEYLQEIKDKLDSEKAEFSIQNSSTHFIAKNEELPFRDNNGELIFRPSGHGALLKNLNELDADIVFIKNIDNIQVKEKNKASLEAKKVLGGFLIQLKQQIDTFLFQLEEDDQVDLEEINEWIRTMIDPLHTNMIKVELINYLKRPVRVAGMVLNEGKAGGGPFWVKKGDDINLEIVEAAQINTADPDQKRILEASTHFNPVDIVCSIKDHRGNKFNLEEFIDPESGFLSQKNSDGTIITIMERPGLWNGSMANWLSVFIELPLESFTPVKTVLDLLPN